MEVPLFIEQCLDKYIDYDNIALISKGEEITYK